MNKGSKKSLKNLKEEAELCFKEENYDNALTLCEQIKKYYPKNYYGYYGIIKAKTKDYKAYVAEEGLKVLKKDFDVFFELYKKDDKDSIKIKFTEYLDDCSEVVNLKKLKKEIVSKEFLKELYNEGITFINQNINTIRSYNLSGKKIVNVYDLIRGIFLFSCLIFNLINRNYLLILTIPFGIFAIITIYSFFNRNFFGKAALKSEKDYVNKIIKDANEQIVNIKKNIEKISENINFLTDQKKSLILKIPEVFMDDIKEYVDQDEELVAESILNELSSNNIPSFTYLIDEKTTLDATDVLLKIKPEIIKEDDELTKFIGSKILERKNSQNEVILMKKVKQYDYVIIISLLIISMLSIYVISKNLDVISIIPFIYAIITGVISALIYNINTGKHKKLMDTLNDNLISCAFNASLIYDLIYLSINDKLNFLYGFVYIPIIFGLILMGFIGVISLLKYNNLIRKLRGK